MNKTMRLGASLVVLLGLLATGPAPVAQAASAPSAVYSPAQARLVASATSPLCKAVSAAAVSHVVGYSLPAPTSTVNMQTDKKLNITGTFTDCTYGTYGSGSPTVDLVYETLSRAVPLSTFQQVIQATGKQMPGADITVKPYAGLGHPALSVTITTRGSYSSLGEEIAAVKGKKVAGADVEYLGRLPKAPLPLSKVAALTKLAMAKFF